MATKTMREEATETSEAQIAVHWAEEGLIPPPASFVGQANLTDPTARDRFSIEKFPECFKEYGDLLSWDKYWTTTLDTSHAPFWKWFVGGRLNVSYNCVDRHLAKYRNKAALIYVPEPEDEPTVTITYQELYTQVNEMAALLRDFCGLKAGDRVTVHMPMCAELPVTMLACARLGVIHSVVFGGFSGQACGSRAADSQSRVLIYMDGYHRNGALSDHKLQADIALKTSEENGHKVEKVLVWQRYPGKNSTKSPFVEGRDYVVNDLLKKFRGHLVDPVSMPAEAPLFLMYTSGTTGQAEGLPAQHRWLSRIRHRDLEVLPGHPSDRRLLVYGRHRLDHRTFLHRLRSLVPRGDQRDVRGSPRVPRRRPSVADRRAARGEHLPHRPDDYPHAPKGRSG